jgi:hypothetical protein
MNIQDSNGSIFTYNDVSYNNEAFSIKRCYNNTFHHNQFNNNNRPSYLSESNNTWHDGNGEGNYWSDYEGIDTNGDGVGDTLLPHLDVDYHPLTESNIVEKEKDAIPSELWFLLSILFLVIIMVILLISVAIIKKRIKKRPDGEHSIIKEQQDITDSKKNAPPDNHS